MIAHGDSSMGWDGTYPPEIIAIEIIFPCPECGARLRIDAQGAGATVQCPPCSKHIRVPHLTPLFVPSSSASQMPASVSRKPGIHLTPEEIDFLNSVETENNGTSGGA